MREQISRASLYVMASQLQRRLLKALRHGFAIAMEAQRKGSLSLGGGVIQFPGVPVVWAFLNFEKGIEESATNSDSLGNSRKSGGSLPLC